MGVSTLMSLAVRTMSAHQAALQATGHNIANAHVAGYSRQQAEFATAGGQFTGNGFYGRGVDVQTISRLHNAYLTREAGTTRSAASMDQTRLQQLQLLERVFPLGEQGLGQATLSFMNAISDLAARPADSASRQVVLARAQELAGRFSAAQSQLDTLQKGVTEDLKVSVSQINTLSKSIADVNDKIASVRSLGQPPNDLLDQRDRLLAELSDLIPVSTIAAEDGTLGVFAAGGQQLVLGKRAQTLTVVADDRDPSRSAVAVLDGNLTRPLGLSTLGGGRLAGLLSFQNTDLVDARNALGQLAASIAGAVNDQQRLGMNLHEPPGSVPPLDLFAVGAPRSVPAAGNAKDVSGAFIGSVDVAVVNAAELQASDYDLRANPAGPPAWQLTRLSDGVVRNVADGDTVDGFRITIGAPPPQPGDRFLLQPVGQAGRMASLLQDPRDIAAASPLTVETGVANTGTASAASFRVNNPAVDPQNTATVTFTNDTGAYAWELRDRTTNALVSSGTGQWVAGEPIPAVGDPDINGFTLELDGVPRNGDTLTVAKTLYPAGNNGNALSLAALRDTRLVGLTRDPGGNLVGGATSTDAYASVLADVGVQVQGAQTLSNISNALAQQAEQARSGASGVNLDEEAARLIEFQQSYQAAAKVLQVAQTVIDTLLQVAAR